MKLGGIPWQTRSHTCFLLSLSNSKGTQLRHWVNCGCQWCQRQDTFASGLNPYSVHGMTEIEKGQLKYRTDTKWRMKWHLFAGGNRLERGKNIWFDIFLIWGYKGSECWQSLRNLYSVIILSPQQRPWVSLMEGGYMPTIWEVQVLWQTMANVLVFARHVGTKFSMNAENNQVLVHLPIKTMNYLQSKFWNSETGIL